MPKNNNGSLLEIDVCIRTKDWKFIKIQNSHNKTKPVVQYLFDLTQNKEIDVTEQHPKTAGAFSEEMNLILRHIQASFNGQHSDEPMSDEEKEILKSLGYIK